jgi:hypothetical protein
MSDEELTKFIDGLQDKLGKENSAVIADDLGILISSNAETQKALKSRDEKIEKLRERNEKLILANGNLLKQIPAEGSEAVQKSEETKKKSTSFSDIFDAHGRFLH